MSSKSQENGRAEYTSARCFVQVPAKMPTVFLLHVRENFKLSPVDNYIPSMERIRHILKRQIVESELGATAAAPNRACKSSKNEWRYYR